MWLVLILTLTSWSKMSTEVKNVLGTELKVCSLSPITGFYRNGSCSSGPSDHGTHIVCATVSKEFLEYTKSKGNDLSTPRPEFKFQGLVPGDKWCLCALRWMQAYKAGKAPKVNLESTTEQFLNYIDLEDLKKFNELKK